MALRHDRRGMALLVDALIFLVVLMLTSAVIHASASHDDADDRGELLRSYHTVMLSAELPDGDGSSMSAVTLSDYIIALSLSDTLDEQNARRIEKMVNGTIAELLTFNGRAWLVIEIGPTVLNFGSTPPGAGSDVHADRRDLGDGSAASTLFIAG